MMKSNFSSTFKGMEERDVTLGLDNQAVRTSSSHKRFSEGSGKKPGEGDQFSTLT